MDAVKKVETELRKARFIKILAEVGEVGVAIDAVGISWAEVRAFYDGDGEFAKDFDEAMQMSGDSIFAEAMRRGCFGIKKKKYYRGEVIGVEKEVCEDILSRLLKFNILRLDEQIDEPARQEKAKELLGLVKTIKELHGDN